MTNATQTVTVADACKRRLWEAGTLTIKLNQGSGTITDIYRITNGFRVHMREFVSVRCQAGDTLTYTPPAPDPQAEIARLTAERDALLDSNAALRSNMSRIAGRAYEARTPDISADTRKALQDIEYIALDMDAGSEPGA